MQHSDHSATNQVLDTFLSPSLYHQCDELYEGEVPLMLLLNAACCPCQSDGAEEKRLKDARAAKHGRTMPRILLSGSR